MVLTDTKSRREFELKFQNEWKKRREQRTG